MKRHPLPLALTCLLCLCSQSFAADPAWWASHGVLNGSPASNLAPATVGQAKHVVAMALAELELRLSPAEYASLETDVNAIVDLSLPTSPAEVTEQRSVLLVGQVKAMAKPFYDHLWALDFPWMASHMTTSNIRVAESGGHSPYPWSVATGDDSNKSVATIGQLKAVFSLPFEAWTASGSPSSVVDTDADGMPDTWEWKYGLDYEDAADAAHDDDGDGLTNLQEYELGTNPKQIDTDGDGMPDGVEVGWGTDPTVADSLSSGPGDDSDGDGRTNAQEAMAGTNPNLMDTDGDGIPDGADANPLSKDYTAITVSNTLRILTPSRP